jgi:hypothetical protein
MVDQFKTARISGASEAGDMPANLATLELAIANAFGIPLDTTITDSGTNVSEAGIMEKALLRQKAAGPVGIRFRDSTSSKEFRFVLSGTNILIDENTGTEGTPAWTNRFTMAIATGTLTVAGAAALASTLAVTGAATLSSTAAVTGATTLSSTLGVAGATTLSSSLAVTGATTLSSTLAVTGVTTFVAGASGPYVKLSEEQASANGGTFTAGDWRTRTLNTEVDASAVCTLAANQVTLAAGVYDVRISAPAYGVFRHQIRLRDVAGGGNTILVGTSERSGRDTATPDKGSTTRSHISGRVTLTGSEILEVQHICEQTLALIGLGMAGGSGAGEVYTITEFWKVG